VTRHTLGATFALGDVVPATPKDALCALVLAVLVCAVCAFIERRRHMSITKAATEDHPEGRERLHMDRITCPYCGWEDQDSWEMTEEGSEVEDDCGRCERPFLVSMYISVSYTSRPIEEADR
jgi:hypothetical protein